MLFLAFLAAPLAYFYGREAARLAQIGAEAIGIVTTLEPYGSRRPRTHNVYFWFIAEDEQRVETVHDTSESFYAAQHVGEEISVRYWRDDPTLAEVEIGLAAGIAYRMRLGLGLFLALIAIFGYLAWRGARAATWLRDHGLRRQVLVLAHVDADDSGRFRAT